MILALSAGETCWTERRRGRVAEGTSLLRMHTAYTCIVSSNLTVSAKLQKKSPTCWGFFSSRHRENRKTTSAGGHHNSLQSSLQSGVGRGGGLWRLSSTSCRPWRLAGSPALVTARTRSSSAQRSAPLLRCSAPGRSPSISAQGVYRCAPQQLEKCQTCQSVGEHPCGLCKSAQRRFTGCVCRHRHRRQDSQLYLAQQE